MGKLEQSIFALTAVVTLGAGATGNVIHQELQKPDTVYTPYESGNPVAVTPEAPVIISSLAEAGNERSSGNEQTLSVGLMAGGFGGFVMECVGGILAISGERRRRR